MMSNDLIIPSVSITSKLYNFRNVFSEAVFDTLIKENPILQKYSDALHAVISEIVINELKRIENNEKDLEDEIICLKQDISTLEEDKSKLEENICGFEKDIAKLENEFGKKIDEIARLEHALDTIGSCISQYQRDNFKLK